MTSLCGETRYPSQGFLELYRLGWGIETFYGLLKTRLELKNFTGTGASRGTGFLYNCLPVGVGVAIVVQCHQEPSTGFIDWVMGKPNLYWKD
ncbi:MAG: hypothetical protein ACXWE4_01530 [Methylobacter sp.]